MIHFPVLRTRRLTVQMRELGIVESVSVAAMPPHLEEATTTAFLRCAIESAKGVEDPAQWTVQERTMAVAHYLASTADDGPDFALGDGRYSDYLDGSVDHSAQEGALPLGELSGDKWLIQHLTGAMAESIERLGGEIPGVSGYLHWLLGGMAAQLVREGEEAPDAHSAEGAYDEFLLARMKVIGGFPDSDFTRLMALYFAGREQLRHLFNIEFSRDGIVVLPKGGAAANLPPARFPSRTCLSRVAQDLVGKPSIAGA